MLARLNSAAESLEVGPDQAKLARRAAGLALELTDSAHCVIGWGDGYDQMVSASADGTVLSDANAAALAGSSGVSQAGGGPPWQGPVLRADLRVAGQSVGMIAVDRADPYTELERQNFGAFAASAALALYAAALRERQNAIESALEQAAEVLTAVSQHAVTGQSLTDFYRRLAKTVGELVGAGKVLFWQLRDDVLTPVPGGYGVTEGFLASLATTPCDPAADSLASRVVFQDLLFRANRSDRTVEFTSVLDELGVSSAMSVPWRAGEERLGLVAAYDSVRPGGFTREDTWVLQNAGLAVGLVTRLWQTQQDLRKSLERLTKVDAARQMLLKSMNTVVDTERKRFVSELHDDALQKLTAAEIHLARLVPKVDAEAASIETVVSLLQETEAALRRLVFEVHPPSLESPDGLEQSIRDRLASLGQGDIDYEIGVDVPRDLTLDMNSLLFRQVSEAINNVERHSRATRVKVTLQSSDGGILGVVEDNGQGFVVAERSNLPGHLGLQALKERTLMADGRYSIESQPGSGTRVEFWIPIPT